MEIMSALMIFVFGGTVTNEIWWILAAEGFFLTLWILLSLARWIKSKPWRKVPERVEQIQLASESTGDDEKSQQPPNNVFGMAPRPA